MKIEKDINNEYKLVLTKEEIEDLLSNRIPLMKPVIKALERKYKNFNTNIKEIIIDENL